MLLKQFSQDSRAAVLPLFAVLVVPVIGFMGVAIDYSRAASVRTEMQAALDATALMLAKEASGLSPTQVTDKTNQYFHAVFTRANAKNIVLTPNVTSLNGIYTVSLGATVTVDTLFSHLLGQNTMIVGSSTEVTWGTRKLELALALDNTGSMAQLSKMTELKKAAKNLLDTLYKTAKKTDDVRVAIVPFATDVNVDETVNLNAAWLDWTAWEAPPANSMPSSNVGPGSNCPYNNTFDCTTGPTNGSSQTNNIPSSGTYKGYICPSADSSHYYNGCYDSVPTTTTSTNVVSTGSSASCGSRSNCSCTGSGSAKVCTQTTTTTGAPYTHNWIVNARSTWNGCVWDREKDPANYDVNDTPPDTTASKFQPHQVKTCSTSMLPMVDILSNWVSADLTSLSPTSTLGKKINQMVATGTTNVTIGLAWGWHALTPNQPLTQGTAPAGDTDKVLILLTDGTNTQNRWTTTAIDIDDRMKKVCDNLKATTIKVYTVRVIDGNAPLLQGCATQTDMYYDVQNATQLNAVFTSIAQKLAVLRIAK